MNSIKIEKKLINIKFPRIIFHNNYNYIYGINSIRDKASNINKFIIECYKYDEKLNFINKININHTFKKSTLIWEIIDEKDYLVFIIEQKSIHKTKHSCNYYKYYIKKNNLENFDISKIEEISLENHLISKIYYNYTLASKIEVDEERPDYYWGKYLFNFFKDDNSYRPKFDNFVNYSKDKGHLIHYIEKKEEEYLVIFSIRHKYENKDEYYYNIYSAKSKDLVNFYETTKIQIENNLSDSEWYCYPDVFKRNDKYYVILNQDDFGKSKETLIGNLYES